MNFPAVPKKKRSSKPRAFELLIHIAIVNYLESVLPPHWIVHHSRNGGISKAENGRAKAMGAKAGFHDILVMGEKDMGNLLPAPMPYCWLLEVKDKKGVLSSEQKRFHSKAERLGFQQRVVRSIDDVREWIIDCGIPNRDLRIPK